jgi:hypothetical protein
MSSLAQAAERHGHSEWGCGTPPGVGSLNDVPQDTPFFTWNGGWQTPRGHFFLSWYSQCLRRHADSMLAAAVTAFYPYMSPAAQATVRERRPHLAADLPTELPSLRRAGSEAGMEAASLDGGGGGGGPGAAHSAGSTGSLRAWQDVASGSGSLISAATVSANSKGSPTDFVDLSRATSAAGSAATLPAEAPPPPNGAESCAVRSGAATPEWEMVPRPGGSANGAVGSCAVSAANATSGSSAWESARWPGAREDGGKGAGQEVGGVATGASSARRTRNASSLRSSASTLSLQSLQPLKRVPLRLSMKLAGASLRCSSEFSFSSLASLICSERWVGRGFSSARRTRSTLLERSAANTLTLECLQPLQRVPLRLSMKLAGAFLLDPSVQTALTERMESHCHTHLAGPLAL